MKILYTSTKTIDHLRVYYSCPKWAYKKTQSRWKIYKDDHSLGLPIRTDRTIQANKPVTLIKHKQNKTCQLIDIGVPSDSNISSEEFGKLSKYKDLEIEIAKMWKLKTKTIPVIVGALGTIKKRIQKYVIEIPRNLSLAEIQNVVLYSNAHILQKQFFLTPTILYLNYMFVKILQRIFLCPIFLYNISRFTTVILTKSYMRLGHGAGKF